MRLTGSVLSALKETNAKQQWLRGMDSLLLVRLPTTMQFKSVLWQVQKLSEVKEKAMKDKYRPPSAIVDEVCVQ